jgi:hypothetical protein
MPQLHIEKQETMSSLQMEFNKHYPYLKIEFFRQAPVAGIGNSKNKIINYDMRLGDIQFINRQGTVDITDKTTVIELESCFANEFGLYIQIFRKSGSIWLETTATDNWTLTQQNEEAKSLEDHLNKVKGNPNDHDIY